MPRAAVRRADRARGRLRKWLWQRRHLDRNPEKTTVFVVGCQRSGTNMLMDTIERAPDAWVYHEDSRSVAFRNYRLRSDEVIERLIRRSYARTVGFKPVCDSHWTDRLLDRHPDSRAIWIYRDYQDVANSAVRNFGAHQADIVRWIVEKDWKTLDWRGERLSESTVDLVHRVYRSDLSPEEGAALFWYMRNQLFFELSLHRDERVLFVRYEHLVGRPGEVFPRVFSFIGCTLDPVFYAGVFESSVRKHAFPEIDPELRKACEELQARLDAEHAARAGC